MKIWTAAAALALLCMPAHVALAADAPPVEEDCTDGVDNDGDTVYDCGDSDCADHPACQPDGHGENTNARCSDWIDNDGNGHTDCDDTSCTTTPGVTACDGSWDRAQVATSGSGSGSGSGADADIPELGPGMSVEDLIGTGGDIDGERNDVDCSDGIDNDGDGFTDCEDFGCRFDPTVTVCRESPGMRFSVVSHITGSYDFETEEPDVRFSTLQLRAFGPMPLIQDSFFLISMRAERSPRLTFAMFQVPLGGGHFLNVNSGGGGLSTALIRSASKQLLVEQPFYLYSAFEQGNGAALDVGGPVTGDGKLTYRAFVAGGSGRYAGNVGGRFFTFDNTNFTYSVGAQLHWNIVGFTSRWDSPMLYTSAPQALSLTFGAKYDQRAQERYPAANLQLTYRGGPLIVTGEAYAKRELEFESWQVAYNISVGVLAIKKHLLLAADFGQFVPTEMEDPPQVFETDLRRQREELQWRVGAHWYFWRNIGVLSVVYSDRFVSGLRPDDADLTERTLRLIAQYRF